MRLLAVLTLALAACVPPALAQTAPSVDRTLSWRTYEGARTARVRVYTSAEKRRPQTIVVDEAPGGPESPLTDEARYAAEFIGRELGVDPALATYVFRVRSGPDRSAPLLLRATFTRARSGQIGAPAWRVISRDELDRLTDRGLY